MPDSTITQLTAIYAAIVATATATWTFVKDWRDTGKLEVVAGFRSKYGSGEVEENLIVWTITNVGRRSLVLTHAAGSLVKPGDGITEFLVNDPHLPRRLEPGDYHMSICREYEDMKRVSRLYAVDSVGRQFDASNEDVKQVNKKLTELQTKGISRSTKRCS